MEYAAREIYFKSPREDMGGAGSGAVCKLNHRHSPPARHASPSS